MKIKHSESVEAKPVEMEGAEGVQIRLLIHEAEGAPRFYMRQFIVAPGGHTPLHTHDWEHEVFVVAGSGAVVDEGRDKPIAAADCVFVQPGEPHQFKNTGGEELKLLCLVPK